MVVRHANAQTSVGVHDDAASYRRLPSSKETQSNAGFTPRRLPVSLFRRILFKYTDSPIETDLNKTTIKILGTTIKNKCKELGSFLECGQPRKSFNIRAKANALGVGGVVARGDKVAAIAGQSFKHATKLFNLISFD